jgi:hypothetical protein
MLHGGYGVVHVFFFSNTQKSPVVHVYIKAPFFVSPSAPKKLGPALGRRLGAPRQRRQGRRRPRRTMGVVVVLGVVAVAVAVAVAADALWLQREAAATIIVAALPGLVRPRQ